MMLKKLVFATVALACMAVFAPQAEAASEPRLLGNYGKWAAYVFMEGSNKVCYMASQPTKAEGNYTRRGDIFALITHRPAEGSKNVFSYITGYPYKPGSDATVIIDGTRYTLFTQDETAWAPDATVDGKLANAIRKGKKMEVKGLSSRGTATTDSFSLEGSSAAHEAISKECGV